MAANALLPNVDISETQAARDNALIAGEVEMATGTAADVKPDPQYLNSQGFFTQTKPAIMLSSTRQNLAGTSHFSLTESSQHSPGGAEVEEAPTPSSTEKGSGVPEPGTSSPTQATPKFTRLKRRSATPDPDQMDVDQEEEDEVEAEEADEADEAEATSAPAPQNVNALDIIMRNQKRKDKQEAAKPSHLIDEQAEESDEDAGWAPKGDDDEREGDDEYLAELVDDDELSPEERERHAALAAAKDRELQAEDDAKREAKAKKIIEGEYRHKRRGEDFDFDDEGDDETGLKRRKFSKKERRQRKLDRVEGLQKLDGEENVFAIAYNQDLETESESEPEEETQPTGSYTFEESISQEKEKPLWTIMRERARMNENVSLSCVAHHLFMY